MQLKDDYKIAYIDTGCSSSISTQVDDGNGSLVLITVGCSNNGAIDITDGSSGANGSPNMGSLRKNISEGTYWFLAAYAQGLKITTGCASKLTVVYKPNT